MAGESIVYSPAETVCFCFIVCFELPRDSAPFVTMDMSAVVVDYGDEFTREQYYIALYTGILQASSNKSPETCARREYSIN